MRSSLLPPSPSPFGMACRATGVDGVYPRFQPKSISKGNTAGNAEPSRHMVILAIKTATTRPRPVSTAPEAKGWIFSAEAPSPLKQHRH